MQRKKQGDVQPKGCVVNNRFGQALNHDGGAVKLPSDVDSRFDYETELVIVIGRRNPPASRFAPNFRYQNAIQSFPVDQSTADLVPHSF
jgi:2-keto-4-pentenoate hydratase/2-oxohepta-3-ene-1,7-dioic acid hydratase in catechol pathway